MARLLLYNICAPEHPPNAPKPGFDTDHSSSLGHKSNPDADELHTHSQTQPYLRNEPTAKVTSGGINGFFRHIFSQDITANEANLDLSDLKYNHLQPRQAEMLLEGKLNRCIDFSSRNQFFVWPTHEALSGFDRDRRMDLAIVPRKMPLSVDNATPSGSPPSDCNLPDVHAILACVEHTVSTGSKGLAHNRDHAYAKLSELLKCPLNLRSIVLGVHGKDMAIWYGDRSGVIEVRLASNASYIHAALVGLANLPFKRDPCVDIYRILPSRAYKITLREEIYYGLYGQDDSVLYTADGINSRGTLVLAGIRDGPLVGTDHVAAFDAATDEDRVAIKFTHPSVPWDVNLVLDGSTHSSDWTLEWEALQILTQCNIPYTPRLVAHDEHSITTKQAREAAGLRSDRYRIRTILVTQPLADSTLRKEIKRGLEIELHLLVCVLKDVVDAHRDAWTIAKIAHCDISPGNIQIHGQRGILADWEYAVSIDQLHTARAVNSGTLHTMPPRLAYYMLYNIGSEHRTISRTPWDEMCSVFLCFIHIILDERRDPDAPPLDRQTTLGHLSLRMTQLTKDLEIYCEHHLRPLYKSNSALVSRIRQAIVVLFPNGDWLMPPSDAESSEWWRKMHDILDSFVV